MLARARNSDRAWSDEGDAAPGGLCASCRMNLSHRFGKNPSPQNYKAFPCESDQQYYPKIIDILSKLPRGSGENQKCTCFICEPAHTDFLSTKLKTGPKPKFAKQTSRDNRSLDQSRLEEVTDMTDKMTHKTKDTIVYARMREKQEQEKSQIKALSVLHPRRMVSL